MLTDEERASKYRAIEDIRQLRCINIRKLRDASNGWQNLAKLTGRSPSFLMQIAGVNPTRAIGEILARDLERVLNLGEGWLDREH